MWLVLTSFQPPIITSHNYDIRISGIHVGTLQASKEVTGDLTYYRLASDVSVNIIRKYHIKDDVSCIYKNNILQSATIATSVGSKNYHSTIIWRKDHYDIDIEGYHYSKKGTETQQIQYSIARIYFDEPPVWAKVFSEDYGVFSEISPLGPNQIQLNFLNKKDKFLYKNGDLITADMQSTIKDFIIQRRF